jgi:hypothetical protein
MWEDLSVRHGAPTSNPTMPPLVTFEHLLLDSFESAAADSVGIWPPLAGEEPGGRHRGWAHTSGHPVTVAGAVELRDISTGPPPDGTPSISREHPSVRVLGYQPEYDQASRRWFVDIALNATGALWPFVRLAVARYQPQSIAGCELSPVAFTSWVQPLPTRTLTVSRPDQRHVHVALTGAVNWLRWNPEVAPESEGAQLGADSPTGEAAVRSARLLETRTVRATVQHRPAGAGDLEWVTSTSVLVPAVVVDEHGFSATWSASIDLPEGGGTSSGDVAASPSLRRPGATDSS